ncbi:hypothetical protein THAOC_07849, partial [Thalassiosira oceanica]
MRCITIKVSLLAANRRDAKDPTPTVNKLLILDDETGTTPLRSILREAVLEKLGELQFKAEDEEIKTIIGTGGTDLTALLDHPSKLLPEHFDTIHATIIPAAAAGAGKEEPKRLDAVHATTIPAATAPHLDAVHATIIPAATAPHLDAVHATIIPAAAAGAVKKEQHELYKEGINREFGEEFNIFWRSATKATIEKKHGTTWEVFQSGMPGGNWEPPTSRFMASYIIEVVYDSSKNAKLKVSKLKGQTTDRSYHQDRLKKLAAVERAAAPHTFPPQLCHAVVGAPAVLVLAVVCVLVLREPATALVCALVVEVHARPVCTLTVGGGDSSSFVFVLPSLLERERVL